MVTTSIRALCAKTHSMEKRCDGVPVWLHNSKRRQGVEPRINVKHKKAHRKHKGHIHKRFAKDHSTEVDQEHWQLRCDWWNGLENPDLEEIPAFLDSALHRQILRICLHLLDFPMDFDVEKNDQNVRNQRQSKAMYLNQPYQSPIRLW